MATMRRYLVAGLLIWIPLVITGWVLWLLIGLVDQTLLLLPVSWRPEAWAGFHIYGLGGILTFAIVLVTGGFAANLFGRKLLAIWDGILNRIPIVRSVYGGVKQISDTLFSPEGKAFRKAVLVHWPHQGARTVGLLTGEPQHEVARFLGNDQVSVFVPTTPNITAGFFIIVPRTDIIELEMSVDEALKYIISMGVAEPLPRKPEPAESKGAGPDPNP
jgi:uncharacterized membrane protein